MLTATTDEYNNKIAELVQILEEYFSAISNYSGSKSSSQNEITSCMRWECIYCGCIYDVEEILHKT